MHNALSKKCPCCSGKLFSDCCSPFLTEQVFPETALQLMRSRYSAYSLANIDYIQHTMCGKAAEGFDPTSAKQWAEHAIWCGLTILDPGKQQSNLESDEVEFAARYVLDNTLHILQERSQFQKLNNRWFYISGTPISHPPISIHPKDPCPCGSRKKFLKCCGKSD